MNDSSIFKELVIVKRSGQRVAFNGAKIAIAIKKAFDSVYDNCDIKDVNRVYSVVLDYISSNYKERKTLNVEDIQNIIENVLKQENFDDVFRSFNNYRLRRAASREVFDKKQQHKFVKATEKLILTARDENNSKPIDLLFNFGRIISSEFSKAYLIDNKYVRSHDEGNIFIHNLDYYALGITNSLHLNLTSVTDYPHYFDKILDILLNIKKEQWEEQSIPSIDYLLIPWLVYKFKELFLDNLEYGLELEGFINYINIHEISDIVACFTTIYIDLNCFKKYTCTPKINLLFEAIYQDTLEGLEKALFNELNRLLTSLNNQSVGLNNEYGYSLSLGTNLNDDGNFITKILINVLDYLPKLDKVTTIFKIKDFNNQVLLENISTLILKDKNIAISNINVSYNRQYLIDGNYQTEIEYFSNGERILENHLDRNQVSLGRMIINRTSINLVRLALKSKNMQEFYQYLDDTLEICKNELIQSFDYQGNKYKENFHYLYQNNLIVDNEKLEDNQRLRKVLKNGVLNIGYIGLKECLYVLTKKNKLTLEDLNLATDIVKYMHDKCVKYSDIDKLNFNLAETYNIYSLKYLESIDKTVYGLLKNVNDNNTYGCFYEIFTKMNIKLEDRFKIESKIQKYSDGGYYEIIHVSKNSSIKKIINLINSLQEYDFGYMKIVVVKDE